MSEFDHQNQFGLFSHLEDVDATTHFTNPDKTKAEEFAERQFQVAPIKSGKQEDALFSDEYQRLFIGEGRGRRDPGRKKKVGDDGVVPFRPSNPPKKHSGAGDYNGTIGEPYEHVAEFAPPRGRREKIQKDSILQFKTNPVKKGGYGIPNTTIGPAPEYIEEGVGNEAKKRLEEHKLEMEKQIGGPYVPTSVPKETFDDNMVYAEGGLGPIPYKKATRKTGNEPDVVPFRLGKWVKSGQEGCFTKKTDYQAEGPEKRKIKGPNVKRSEHPKPFYTTYKNKSLRQPSILLMRSNVGY